MTEESQDYDIGEGSVRLSRDSWLAVIAALEGSDDQRDAAFDALQRWAPTAWIQELDSGSLSSHSDW